MRKPGTPRWEGDVYTTAMDARELQADLEAKQRAREEEYGRFVDELIPVVRFLASTETSDDPKMRPLSETEAQMLAVALEDSEYGSQVDERMRAYLCKQFPDIFATAA